MKKVIPGLDKDKDQQKNRPASSNDLQKIEERIFERFEDQDLVSSFESARFAVRMTDEKLNNVFNNVETKCFDAHK